MKQLKDFLEGVSYTVLQGSLETEIEKLEYDSRKVQAKTLFVCIEGTEVDGHKFAQSAVDAGAVALFVTKPVEVTGDVTIVQVEDSRKALAYAAAAYFDHPAEKLKVIGVTGTKGKTTTTYMVRSVLESAGMKTGLIGTIEAIIGQEHIPAKNTTPESFVIQEYFARMVQAGCKAVVMEVSSQGLMMHRTDGFTFELGIFTNIEPDHIGPNEHKDFEEYMACKGLLFKQCRYGIVNFDDHHTKDVLKGHTCEVLSYGLSEGADIQAVNIELVKEPGYLGVAYDTKGAYEDHIIIDMPGKFSVYNSLAALCICRHFGVEKEIIRGALKTAKARGRVEKVETGRDFTILLDYAHNAMALSSLLSTLKEYNPGRLVCVFGCGGNRSKLRRYEMGEVSGKLADFTIITSDNPRFEEPAEIMADIETGMKKTQGAYVCIEDRREAIAYSVEHAKSGDVIIVAGKGHEDYQEIKGVKYPMDDRELIESALKK
ncbi:MAG: UDP-N-acetylmuramoyl-L-alanyl-D-glutamate--2,6-diaminopimelate ligase [Lachnospiraceae bacterium]|jgi:UDP-N-acetylmuramoyl-L-alanyl-D-glutamate--2,6-diaminopimelate ligase|nr:UDP-N-acetylmuramoyl-L-alanyl-D-glutamate--2,6-diaminopimelate ligase [Lachnospiraceae bacterium]